MRWKAPRAISAGVIAVVGLALLVSCGGKTEVKPTIEKPEARAVIKTKFGDIEMKFLPEVAPGHVENFMKLAKAGFYNGTIFHRVIPGFMIQGGDPNTKDSLKKDIYGQGGPGYTIKAEFSDIPHKRGVVSMARAQEPDTGGSQFFIVVEDSPYLDGKYTVFGKITKGIGVADKIANEPRDERDNPKDRVEMTVTIVE
ncbi:MAG: peptidylprolyl isomerase [Nitrospira sp.]|nr:peptidylprolyl isomerase [Nitrospira sp.]